METLTADLTRLLGASAAAALPHDHRQQGGHSSSEETAKHYFSQLSKKQVHELYELYALDHQLYGYDPHLYLDMAKRK